MNETSLLQLFGQLLLPLFMMALLFGLCGINPESVVKAASAVVVALLSGTFSVVRYLLSELFGTKNRTTRTKASGTGRGPGRRSSDSDEE